MKRTEKMPLLLLVTSGLRHYREYLLKSIATRYRVHLITAAEATWELPYLTGSAVLPDTGEEAVRAAAGRIAAQQPVSGIMSWHEEHIVQAAMAAEDLGLPGTRAAAVRRCRDKFATRTALAAEGLPQPAFVLTGDRDEALAAADKLGYPVVLKPRAAGGSQGVVLVHDAAELADHFAATRDVPVPHTPDFDAKVLVEEYLDAPEVSVDAVVHRGKVIPLFVARKEIGFPPYFEEVGHRLDGGDPLLADPAFARMLQDVHTALGCTDGWTHSEIRLTSEGPKLIEVNGRLGGDLIPYLGLRASGVDPGLAAAAVACGEEPQIAAAGRERSAKVAGVRFFYPPGADSLIESVEFDRSGLPPEVDLLIPLAAPGSVVSPPRKGDIDSRIACATAVAASAESCTAALDAAQAAMTVRTGAPAGGGGARPPLPTPLETTGTPVHSDQGVVDAHPRHASGA